MRSGLVSVTALGFLAVPQSASAEEAAVRPEDIVVTATRTSEVLRDVPADVTVRDFDALRRDGFTFGTDEFRGVPGISFRRGYG